MPDTGFYLSFARYKHVPVTIGKLISDTCLQQKTGWLSQSDPNCDWAPLLVCTGHSHHEKLNTSIPDYLGLFKCKDRGTELCRKSNYFFFPADCMADCAGYGRKEEAVFSIISLHLQVTCSGLSSAKSQLQVVTAPQTRSFVRLGRQGLSRLLQKRAESLPWSPFLCPPHWLVFLENEISLFCCQLEGSGFPLLHSELLGFSGDYLWLLVPTLAPGS